MVFDRGVSTKLLIALTVECLDLSSQMHPRQELQTFKMFVYPPIFLILLMQQMYITSDTFMKQLLKT